MQATLSTDKQVGRICLCCSHSWVFVTIIGRRARVECVNAKQSCSDVVYSDAQMDSKLKRCRSLPPLVDGKVYGYLKLIIDKIVWSKRNPGNVLVLASWWGENNSLHFKYVDVFVYQLSLRTFS